ncbi:MAG: hypothetical protein ACK53Y_21730 [bacterium]
MSKGTRHYTHYTCIVEEEKPPDRVKYSLEQVVHTARAAEHDGSSCQI